MSSGSFKQAVDRVIELCGADIAMDEAVTQACRELGGGFNHTQVKAAAQDEWSDAARKAAAESRKGGGGKVYKSQSRYTVAEHDKPVKGPADLVGYLNKK